MPGMTGTQILEALRETHDHIIRILITGYADMKTAVDAINKGQVHRYITKPWDPQDVKSAVSEELRRFDLQENNKRLTRELLLKNRELEEANAELKRSRDEIERLALEYKEQKEIAIEMSEKLARSNLDLLKAQEEIQLKNVKLEAANKKLERLSITDALTGFYNKRHLYAIMEGEIGRAKRYDLNLSILMIDMDNFKTINDTWGHPFGDLVLKRVTEKIRRNIRETDYPTRYGGDEFLVILPHTGVERALYMAKRMHTDIRVSHLTSPNGSLVTPSVSIGLAYYPHPKITNKEQMVALADEALYRAKHQGGRDCIIVAE
jgi:diguanylate cyclase (GGDEF)-like protein